MRNPEADVVSMDVSPDGKLLAWVTRHGGLMLADLVSGTHSRVHDGYSETRGVRFASDAELAKCHLDWGRQKPTGKSSQ